MQDLTELSGMPIRHPEFAERLSQAMHAAGLSITDIKNRLGITYEMARRYTLGLAMPRKEKLSQLAVMVNKSPSFLAFGFEDPSMDRNMGHTAEGESHAAHSLAAHSAGMRVVALDDSAAATGVARIRKVKLRLSAGIAGFATDPDTEETNPIFFRRDWLDKRGYVEDNLIAIRVRGQSMEPGLFEGDTVVINTRDIHPIDGEVYAVNYEGEAVIKRLVRDNGQWWLASDNADQRRFPRKLCDATSCIVIGRIIQKQSERI